MTEPFASERQDYDRHLAAEIVAMLHDAWRVLALLHAILNLNLKVRKPQPSEPQLPAVAWRATRLLSLPLASSGGPVAAFRAPAAPEGREAAQGPFCARQAAAFGARADPPRNKDEAAPDLRPDTKPTPISPVCPRASSSAATPRKNSGRRP
jgi:hypothetical protein